MLSLDMCVSSVEFEFPLYKCILRKFAHIIVVTTQFVMTDTTEDQWASGGQSLDWNFVGQIKVWLCLWRNRGAADSQMTLFTVLSVKVTE